MEKEIKIITPDRKVITGILRGSLKKPLIIIVHGLAGGMNEALHYNAARFFEKHGYSSFRFDLYHWNKNSRKLHECTLKTHGQDIDTVMGFFRSKGLKNSYIVGHSYGFPSILHSTCNNFSAIVSWDGSCLPHNDFNKLKKVQELNGRIFDEGYWTIMGEAMVKESQQVSSIRLTNNLKVPIKFITVSTNKAALRGATKMYNAANAPKDLKIIEGATHNFAEEGKQEELYIETVRFFKKHEAKN